MDRPSDWHDGDLSELLTRQQEAVDWAGLLHQLCEQARLSLEFDRCSVTVLEYGNRILRTAASSVSDPRYEISPVGTTYPLEEFGGIRAIIEGRRGAFYESDLSSSDDVGLRQFVAHDPPVLSSCLAPLTVDGKVMGFAHGYDLEAPRVYDDRIRHAFEGMARLMSLVLRFALLSRRLARSERHYRDLVELSGDLVLTLRPDGTLTYASAALKTMCDLAEGMGFEQLLEKVHPEDRERTRHAWDGWPGTGGLVHFENRIQSTDQGSRRIHWNVRPVLNDEGQLSHVQAVGRDFTDWYRLEEKLRGAQRSESIAGLARGFAHEFNNMLVSVLGNASVLSSQLDGDHEWRPIVDEIANGADRAAKLTRQLLTYARSAHRIPQRRRFNELVRESIELGQTALPGTVRVEIRPEATNDWIEADPMQVQQVLLNLVMNAADAMPEGGTVSVRTENSLCRLAGGGPETECVDLVVEDAGVGIAPEDRERIFDPFFSTKEMGRGLGLAAVQGIVEAHGGQIEVDSTLGEGTCFRIRFATVSPGGD